jgi:hypothetical protein
LVTVKEAIKIMTDEAIRQGADAEDYSAEWFGRLFSLMGYRLMLGFVYVAR